MISDVLNRDKIKELQDKKLLRVKEYTDGPYEGFRVLKYTSKTHFENAFRQEPILMECRGLILDQDDNIVSYPFSKVYNLGEKDETGTPVFIDDSTYVNMIGKVNGFLGVMSIRNGVPLFSTTGTLDSDYVRMCEETIMRHHQNLNPLLDYLSKTNSTAMFEIVHPNDPHIVDEEPGAYLIGIRENRLGSICLNENFLNLIAFDCGLMRPNEFFTLPFGEVKEAAENCEHEGYMVRDLTLAGNYLCKLKSPYYKIRKFYMRGKAEKVYNSRVHLDSYYYVDDLNELRLDYSVDEWNNLKEQERRAVLDHYMHLREIKVDYE